MFNFFSNVFQSIFDIFCFEIQTPSGTWMELLYYNNNIQSIAKHCVLTNN